MILWTIKLFTTLRRAIAGRRYPAQLAWAVAFGVLLGIIPHGNLLAILLLIVVLSLKINHAAAGLTAIGVSFLATKLDPISHQIGNFVLTQPRVADAATNAWAFPLVPWTDLNNTVVMGSLIIGLVALLPIVMVTYPVFRLFKPAKEEADTERARAVALSHPIEVVHQPAPGRSTPPAPHIPTARPLRAAETPQPQRPIYVQAEDGRIYPVTQASHEPIEFFEIDRGHTAVRQPTHATETRIDVVRVAATKPESDVSSSIQSETNAASQPQGRGDEAQPMDEALNYLLRQLRDSQTRNVA